ncbi:MAG: class I SAM-dependent methyltransferase, partial [Lutibacter sp.]
MQNPFRAEELRHRLAHNGDLSALKRTYTKNFAEIKDLNKKKFWNKRIVIDRPGLKHNPIYQDKMDIISRHLRTQKGKILDIGFGWGVLENKIADNKNIQVSGIDISTEAVRYAKANLKGKFKTSNIFDIPFEKNEFDIVVALDILEHIKPSKIFSAYKEIHRVLKKGGTFFVSIPINEGLEEMVKKGSNPVSHLRIYTPDIIQAELKLSGFEIVKTEFRFAFRKLYKLK